MEIVCHFYPIVCCIYLPGQKSYGEVIWNGNAVKTNLEQL